MYNALVAQWIAYQTSDLRVASSSLVGCIFHNYFLAFFLVSLHIGKILHEWLLIPASASLGKLETLLVQRLMCVSLGFVIFIQLMSKAGEGYAGEPGLGQRLQVDWGCSVLCNTYWAVQVKEFNDV